MNYFLLISLFILSLASPNLEKFPNGDGHAKGMLPLQDYLFDLSYLERNKIGITRTYAPDNTQYFINEPLGHFMEIYLSIGNNDLEKIYEYPSTVDGRSEEVIEIFWGGKSDRIILYFPFRSENSRVLEYSINDKRWTSVDTSSMDGEMIAPIYYSNDFLIKDNSGYKRFNFISGQSIQNFLHIH